MVKSLRLILKRCPARRMGVLEIVTLGKRLLVKPVKQLFSVTEGESVKVQICVTSLIESLPYYYP